MCAFAFVCGCMVTFSYTKDVLSSFERVGLFVFCVVVFLLNVSSNIENRII